MNINLLIHETAPPLSRPSSGPDQDPTACPFKKRRLSGFDDACVLESDSESVFLSTRSSVSSASPSPELEARLISSRDELMLALSHNCHKSLELCNINIVDRSLSSMETCNPDARKAVINTIHERYVEPLLDATGFKWVRKEIPSKGRGLKLFALKYQCSQQQKQPHKAKLDERSRQLTNPLKQFSCESLYTIRYTWQTQTLEINYRHMTHAPLKRLPEALKPYILQRLDMKALDLYNAIIAEPKFSDIKHLIIFSKVQSFWSKERNSKKEESTKLAFKQFLSATPSTTTTI